MILHAKKMKMKFYIPCQNCDLLYLTTGALSIRFKPAYCKELKFKGSCYFIVKSLFSSLLNIVFL